ncbi:MAG: DNA topoisomerase IB [Cyanobacteria bacterium P01_A01_bin.15]
MPPCSTVLYQDAANSAQIAGLRYVSDSQPGIQRRRWGRGFTYLDPDGNRIQAGEQRRWLTSLAIPPNWEDVWICPNPNGHLQATGRDARGRKQYRYHPDWIQLRNQLKFDRLIPFAKQLPVLRQRVRQQLGEKPALNRTTVVAAIVQLLDNTLARIGNVHYSQVNGSYGLTTLRKRHVDISKDCLTFQFRGKSGVDQEIDLQNRRLAKIVKRCQDIPGYTLFQYLDQDGERQTVDSEDVNRYLQTTMGDSFTAKDFRTWGGTVVACRSLAQPAEDSGNHITRAIKAAAQQLGNRPATCRKYYIHPAVIEAYEKGWLTDCFTDSSSALLPELTEDEQYALNVLKHKRAALLTAA